MPLFTVPSTGVYRTADGKDVRQFTQGDQVDVVDAVRFGMAGAALPVEIIDRITEIQAFAGGSPQIVVAASDAPVKWRRAADYACDGTDDQVQIQAAIDALPSSGGRVVLSPGTFVVAQAGSQTADTFTTPYCVRVTSSHGPLEVVGQAGTVVRMAANQAQNTVPFLIRGTAAAPRTNPTLVQGIYFDGNAANQSNLWTDMAILLSAYARRVTVRECEFVNAPSGTGGSGAACLLFFRDSRQFLIDACVWTQTQTQECGARFECPEGIIVNCTAYGHSENPNGVLALNANTDIQTPGQQIKVIHNRIKGGQNGISLGGVTRCLVAFNTIEDIFNAALTAGAAIFLTHNATGLGYTCDFNAIVHNVIYNCRNGIRLQNGVTSPRNIGCRDNLVQGNLVMTGPSVSLGVAVGELGSTVTNDNWFLDNLAIGATTHADPKGSRSRADRNRGWGAYDGSNNTTLTKNDNDSGTGTIPSGSTSVTIAHKTGRAITAAQIRITPTNNPTNDPGNLYVSGTPTATTFDVACRSDPGSGGATFSWAVMGVH